MRALVVGLGRMGRFHRRALRDLGYEVLAVDPHVPEAEYRTIESAFLDQARGFSMGSARGFDVAAVAVPIPELVGAAFQLAGLPMLVEKPFAPDLPRAAMLAAYLKDKGAPVAVGFVERFNPQVRRLREWIEENDAGGAPRRLEFVRHNDRPSPDVETDLLTHDVDLARHLSHGLSQLRYCSFDCRDAMPEKRREITASIHRKWRPGDEGMGMTEASMTVDLLDHDQSPLHALWHAFLTDSELTPRPGDAIEAMVNIERVRERGPETSEAAT